MAMRAHPDGANARVIGDVQPGRGARVVMQTALGGSRMVDMLVGEQLPRIC
jgi:hydrogenase expression/formation protein HypE